ncbi:MAG TPA: response regulator transcription factor [Methylomirabilota bacterium]|nr:response regulator transcription factor [Methylomirabilota bacterium]
MAPVALTHSMRRRPGILVVEDDPKVRSFLRRALASAGRVFEASDGERAMEILRVRRDLDLVLADYKLPKRSGLEVLHEAKRRCPWMPVVIMTAFGSEEFAVQAFRDGASDYLIKPVGLNALMRTVSALIHGRPAVAPEPSRRTRDGAVDPRIRRALAFLRTRFAEGVTLAAVAATAGLSRFHFCRLFHRNTGRGFRAYVHELRIAHAKRLLADGDVPVTRVAYAVGFKDVSHFDKAFRKIVGHSPTQYRASLPMHEPRKTTLGKSRRDRPNLVPTPSRSLRHP